RVTVAEVYQRPGEGLFEQQIAGQAAAGAPGAADATEQCAHTYRQCIDVAGGDVVQPLGRRDHQRIDRPQRHPHLLHHLRRNASEDVVDALQLLDVYHQLVEKDARQRVTGDLSQRRIAVAATPRVLLAHAPHADDEDAL